MFKHEPRKIFGMGFKRIETLDRPCKALAFEQMPGSVFVTARFCSPKRMIDECHLKMARLSILL